MWLCLCLYRLAGVVVQAGYCGCKGWLCLYLYRLVGVVVQGGLDLYRMAGVIVRLAGVVVQSVLSLICID